MSRWADILRCWARVTGKMFLLPLAGKLLHHGLEEGEHFLGFTQGIPFDAEGSSLIHVYDARFYVPSGSTGQSKGGVTSNTSRMTDAMNGKIITAKIRPAVRIPRPI